MKTVVRLTESELNEMVNIALNEYCFNILEEYVHNDQLNEDVNEFAPLIGFAARALAKPVTKFIGKKVGKGVGRAFTKGVAKAGTNKLGQTLGKNISKRQLAKIRQLLQRGVSASVIARMFPNMNKQDIANALNNNNMNNTNNMAPAYGE